MAKAKSPAKLSPRTAEPGGPAALVSAEERQRLIAEAAYLRAAARGFEGGDPVQDWLAAEREIARLLPSPQQQKQELAAYEKLRAQVRHLLAETRDTLSADTVRNTLEQAVAQLRQLGEHTADAIDKAAAAVERDLAGAAQRIGPKWEAFSEKTADLFEAWRDRGRQSLTDATTALADWLQRAGGRLKTHTYRTGEVAAAGTLECLACGGRIVLATSAHVPPCPKCKKMEFRRLG